ncbi:response regulator, partial [Teredinibacter waterburyi]|uniref:response regulator n=1 Tax=Teredinibacter waterburyi TaxID=1500538 RepID=UPI00165FEB7D
MTHPPAFLTTGQAATYCGVSLRTIINWINKGLLKAHQLPGSRGDNRIAAADLVAFMQSNELPIPSTLEEHVQPNRMALVVDDDESMARSVARHLKGLGFITGLAHNGFDAGVSYATLKPSLMTLDLQMPRMDGFALLEQLANQNTCKIIVISG